MRVTLFTSNQPRHIALAESLADVVDELNVVSEIATVFPGQVEDFFKKSDVMARYFKKVLDAQQQVFGDVRPFPAKAKVMAIKIGDLNLLAKAQLAPMLEADVYVVFGSSFIKGWLIEFLSGRPAYNIHMGVSPYYRGNSCNFWACHDGKFDYVGATIHRLTKGLDSGEIYFHTFPPPLPEPFLLGMAAVRSAHEGLTQALRQNTLEQMTPVIQDRSKQIRYTRNVDFNDDVAAQYLAREIHAQEVLDSLQHRDMNTFLNPYLANFKVGMI